LAAFILTRILYVSPPFRISGFICASFQKKSHAPSCRRLCRGGRPKVDRDLVRRRIHTVSDFYFAQRDETSRQLSSISPLNEELDRLSKDGAIALVSEEGPGLAYADVLHRGAFGSRTDVCGPAFLISCRPACRRRWTAVDWRVDRQRIESSDGARDGQSHVG